MKPSFSSHDSRSTAATAGAVFQMVLGSLSVCVGIVLVAAQRLLLFFLDFPGRSLNVLLILFFALGFWLIEKGTTGMRLARLFRRLSDALDPDPITLSQASARTGVDEKTLLSEIARMIRRGGFWGSAAVLEDCVVLERGGASRPQMLMADEGMVFAEKKHRGRVPIGLLLGLCAGTALGSPFRPDGVGIAALGCFAFYQLSFVLYRRNLSAIRCLRQEEQAAPAEVAPAETGLTGDSRADELIAQGQNHLRELAALGVTITDPHIRMRIEQINLSTRQLLGLLKSHPEKHSHARQSIEYCLPTTVKLLHQYDELSSQPVKGENIRESLDKITEMSDMVAEILGRELDSLYEDRALNIEVDVEVMKSMMQHPLDITARSALPRDLEDPDRNQEKLG